MPIGPSQQGTQHVGNVAGSPHNDHDLDTHEKQYGDGEHRRPRGL